MLLPRSHHAMSQNRAATALTLVDNVIVPILILKRFNWIEHMCYWNNASKSKNYNVMSKDCVEEVSGFSNPHHVRV